MALARTNRDSEVDELTGGAAMSGASSAFTPSNNSLLVNCFKVSNGGDVSAGTLGISGGGWTYTARLHSTPQYFGGSNPGYYGRIGAYTAPVSTGASMSTTITSSENSGNDRGEILQGVFDYTGYDTSTPIGGTATNVTAGDAGLTLTLDAAPASGDEVIAWRGRQDSGTVATGATPNAAFTEQYDLSSPTAGYADLQIMTRTGSTSTSVVWDDTSTNASASSYLRHSNAMVIKVASAAGGAGPLIRGGPLVGHGPLLRGRLIGHSPSMLVKVRRVVGSRGEVFTYYDFFRKPQQAVAPWRMAA
jgi:hypothetical protein